MGSPLETSKGCWGPLRSPTAPRGPDASRSLASWGCGQDERRRSLIFTSAEVAVRSQALPWSLGGSQRRGGFWRLRPPAGPRQLVCKGPTARLLSPAPPSVSAPPFPHSQEPLAVCPPRPCSPPPTTLLVLLQRPQLPQRAPYLSCWAGLLSGPRPLRHSLFRPSSLLFAKGPGATARVTSAQAGRGWAGGTPGAASPTLPWDLLQTDPLSLASAPIRPELPCCL